jgi:hypothetical protein
MMHYRFAIYRGLVWIICALVCLLASSAQALEPAPAASLLTIEPLAPISIGERASVRVRLSDATGQVPGAHQIIQMFVDGVAERRLRSDESGAAAITTLPIITSGTHRVEVVFHGTPELPGARAALDLVVYPATLTIQTVPPLPGVQFALAGQVTSADERGTIQVTVDRAATYRLAALPPPATDDLRWEWSRWNDNVFVPERDISVPKITRLEAGFTSSARVHPEFADVDGHTVDPRRITSLTVSNSLQHSYTFAPEAAPWLPRSSIAYEQGQLWNLPITYTVEGAIVDGANVVPDDAVQPDGTDQPWRIALNLYDVSFIADDMLTQQPIGTGIEVEHPLGRIEQFPFGPDHTVHLKGLAPGLYRVRVMGAPGIAPIVLVRVPDERIAHLYVISWVDLALCCLLLLDLMLLLRTLWYAQRLLTQPLYESQPLASWPRRLASPPHRERNHG